jgi:hypothetical protein
LSKSKLRTEKYDLPGTTDGICALIREVLNGGQVQRLEIDNDDTYVRVRRWVEDDGLGEDKVTWDGALRNVPNMVEYYSDEATSFQVVVDMMLLAQADGLISLGWVTGVGEDDLLRKWFELDGRSMPVGGVDYLLGLPVHRVKSLPEETLILGCSKYPGADPEEITMAIKTTIDLRRSNGTVAVDKDADRGRDHSCQHVTTAGQLALTTGGLREVPWNPPGES